MIANEFYTPLEVDYYPDKLPFWDKKNRLITWYEKGLNTILRYRIRMPHHERTWHFYYNSKSLDRTRKEYERLPKEPIEGIYIIQKKLQPVNENIIIDLPLYVGMSKNIACRINAHPNYVFLSSLFTDLHFWWFDTRHVNLSTLEIEKQLISSLNPLLNVKDNFRRQRNS